jgi:glycosyltransferase involved in cell wall biosynthesis
VVGAVEDLDSVFDTIRLTVAPLRFGAGIKGKVLDSFAAGLPCVMTPIAAEGLPLTGGLPGAVGEAPAALADIILGLDHDAALNARLAEDGRRLIAAEFSQHRVTQSLEEALSRPPSAITAAAPAQHRDTLHAVA